MEQAAPRIVVNPDASTHLAWIRTRLSIERTLMAGVRTATALVGFGFTIVQFFHRMDSLEHVQLKYPAAPGYLGLALIAAGVLQIVFFLVQYHRFVAYLWGPDYQQVAGIQHQPGTSSSVWVAYVVIVIGLFAFGSVLLQLL
jgi:putative membrane protein